MKKKNHTIFAGFFLQGIEELRNVIIQQTLAEKYMGEKIPQAWLSLEKKLIEYREEKKVDILPFKTLETLGAACGVFGRGEVILFYVGNMMENKSCAFCTYISKLILQCLGI